MSMKIGDIGNIDYVANETIAKKNCQHDFESRGDHVHDGQVETLAESFAFGQAGQDSHCFWLVGGIPFLGGIFILHGADVIVFPMTFFTTG